MDIKELIAEGKSLQENKVEKVVKVKKKAEITYQTILENDSDFVIERKTSTTDKMLVCILSQGLLYFKDVKTGELKNGLSEKDIVNFLSDCKVDCYPKTLKYEIRENTQHLSNYFNWAIRNLNTAKELVKDKIFIRLNNPTFHNEFINITSQQIKDLKWCINFIDGFKDFKWNYPDYLYSTYKWLHAMEKIGINRDKLSYNKSKMVECNFDEFKYYSFNNAIITDMIKLGNLEFNNFYRLFI